MISQPDNAFLMLARQYTMVLGLLDRLDRIDNARQSRSAERVQSRATVNRSAVRQSHMLTASVIPLL